VAVVHFSVSLRGWTPGPEPLRAEDFLEPLHITPRPPVIALERGRLHGQATRVVFFRGGPEDYASSAEPSEAFAAALAGALHDMAAWLRERSVEDFGRVRGRGVRLDISISGAVTDDQFELGLPSALLEAAGARGLDVKIVTND
jgi:hypothetical protein